MATRKAQAAPEEAAVEPQLNELSVTASTDGEVKVKKYGDIKSGYFYSARATYTIPEGYSEEDAAVFRQAKLRELRDELDPIAQETADDLIAQRFDNDGGFD
jgi:hypothetical protein